MPPEYNFEIGTDLSPSQVLETLSEVVDTEPSIKPINDSGTVVATLQGFAIFAHQILDAEDEALLGELGIKSTIGVTFRFRSGHEEAVVKSALSWILVHPEGDAGLLFNGEVVLFLWKDQHLIINTDTDFWIPAYLEIITLPYEKRGFPIL